MPASPEKTEQCKASLTVVAFILSLLEMTDGYHDSDFSEDHNRKPRGRLSHPDRKDAAGRLPRHRPKHRDDGRRRHEEGANEKERRPSILSKIIAAHSEGDSDPLFVIDRKGDPNNVLYGGNDNSITPRYHKAGYGSVIGTDRRYRISKDGSKAFGYGFVPDGAQRGLASSLLSYRDNSKFGRKVKTESLKGDDGIRLQHAYVAIDTKLSKRRKRSNPKPRVDNALQVVIGRLNGSRREEEDAPEPSESSSDSSADSSLPSEEEVDAYDTFRNDVRRQRFIELNRATIERPGDIAAWLALIEHQAFTFGTHDSEYDDTHSATDQHSLAEIRIGLYEKALTKVKDATSRERLVIGLMNEGSLIWDSDALSRKWEAVLKTGFSTDIYIRYLNFRQTQTAFNYEECLSIHRECLERAFLEKDAPSKDELCSYVLLRTTTLMSQSGYLERATAIWQSVLEFTFFRPSQLDPSTELSCFQAFWESEIPRIGEAGAAGWKFSHSVDAMPRTDIIPDPTSHHDVHQIWVTRENETALNSVLPARTLDNVAEDDPFRVILFSDIEEYLFAPNSLTGRLLLLNAFVKFCGLPALHRLGVNLHGKWWTDPFLAVTAGGSQQPLGSETAIVDTATLFWSEDMLSVFDPFAFEMRKAETSFGKTALRQLVDILPDDDDLAEYTIAFEASINPKEARKYVKSLLKGRSSNLRLYNAYALLECRLDRFDVADHAWATAISMCHPTSMAQHYNRALVWCSWLWELVRRRMLPRAQQVLLSIPGGRLLDNTPESFENATSRMRVRSYLDSHLAQHTSLRQERAVLRYTELLAIYEYLASSQSLPSALTVYSATLGSLNEIPASGTLIEAVHQSRARLLYLHSSLSPRGYIPAEINRVLAESLRTFPENSMFHHLYHERIRRSGLLERIREALPEKTVSSQTVEHDPKIIPLLFAIQIELSRPGYAGSTHHSIRAAFERSVDAAKPCVRIWTWYIKWETSLLSETNPMGEETKELHQRRNKAVDVYYRGIRACPWAKRLHLLAFSEAPLRNALRTVELGRIYDRVIQMGLRVHVDLRQ